MNESELPALYQQNGRYYYNTPYGNSQLYTGNPADFEFHYRNLYGGAKSSGSGQPPRIIRSGPQELGEDWRRVIEEANAATMADRDEALGLNRRSARRTRRTYNDIFSMLENRRGEIESGYGRAAEMLRGTQESALSDIERGRTTADSAGSVGLMDRGLYSTTVKDAMERRNRESADRSRGAVYADYGRQLSGLERERTGEIAAARTAEAGARSEMAQIMNAIRAQRAGILERTVREAPSYGDIAALYGADAAAKAGKRSSRNQLLGGLFGLGGSLLGGLL